MTPREMFNKLDEWKAKDYQVSLISVRNGWVCRLETFAFYQTDGSTDEMTHALRAVSKVCATPEGAIENMASIVA